MGSKNFGILQKPMSCVDASLLLPFLLASGVAALASCGLSLATLRGVRDMNFASPHDGEAGAVREARAGVIRFKFVSRAREPYLRSIQ